MEFIEEKEHYNRKQAIHKKFCSDVECSRKQSLYGQDEVVLVQEAGEDGATMTKEAPAKETNTTTNAKKPRTDPKRTLRNKTISMCKDLRKKEPASQNASPGRLISRNRLRNSKYNSQEELRK